MAIFTVSIFGICLKLTHLPPFQQKGGRGREMWHVAFQEGFLWKAYFFGGVPGVLALHDDSKYGAPPEASELPWIKGLSPRNQLRA